MPFEGKLLASGEVPLTQEPIYTAPVNSTVYVKFFSVTNENGLSNTVEFWVKPVGQPARHFGRWLGRTKEFVHVIEKEQALNLQSGDAIEALATLGSAEFVITGGVET